MIKAPAGQFYRMDLMAGVNFINLELPMSFRVTRRYNNAISIYRYFIFWCQRKIIVRGALLYGLRMNEQWKELRHYAFNSSDWKVLPSNNWAYGLKVDVNNPSSSIAFEQAYLKYFQQLMNSRIKLESFLFHHKGPL